MRQILLDTETTGLDSNEHRIIEIGCVEMIDRKQTDNSFHQYLQPDRKIEAEAIDVHGISNEFLLDKPRFINIADDFINYIKGAEVIIHNAPFDVGFLNMEFKRLGGKYQPLEDFCTITDTLVMARSKYPSQRNSLDALCKRYAIDNSARTKHGALLDAEILAEVYLALTGGQRDLDLQLSNGDGNESNHEIKYLAADRPCLKVINATPEELVSHQSHLEMIQKSTDSVVWLKKQ